MMVRVIVAVAVIVMDVMMFCVIVFGRWELGVGELSLVRTR